jgi:hypothetical protein
MDSLGDYKTRRMGTWDETYLLWDPVLDGDDSFVDDPIGIRFDWHLGTSTTVS